MNHRPSAVRAHAIERGGRASPRAWLVLATALAAWTVWLIFTAGTVHAGSHALTLPADAGSRWEVIAGYNTGTHNGSNPWALDIVRRDAPTAGSIVRAPLDGVVGYVSSDCLTVDDGPDISVLLCHLYPSSGLRRGQAVSRGATLGTVAPDGEARNNGIAHIHIAVHSSAGGFGPSIPMTGRYALEGHELWATGEWNAYGGRQFTATTTAASQLAGSVTAPLPAPVSGGGTVISGSVPQGSGIGLFVYSGGNSEGLAAAIGCPTSRAVFWTTSGGRFVVFVPGSTVPAVNASWHAHFSDGVPVNAPLLARCTG